MKKLFKNENKFIHKCTYACVVLEGLNFMMRYNIDVTKKRRNIFSVISAPLGSTFRGTDDSGWITLTLMLLVAQLANTK